jgi:putative molybdopterin biosynthesis protein
MHRLQLHYTLSRNNSPALIHNPLIDLLNAVAQAGSISAAARQLGLSYRHVWGELKRWEQELGGALLVWEKGQPARLSAFGDKLRWAERQAQARLTPQIQALRSDLERAFAMAFDDRAPVLTFYASHDEALMALREHVLALASKASSALAAAPGLHLDIRFCGSVDAIRGLNEGRCIMAGFHTLQCPAPGSLAERSYKPLLQPGQHKIIGFAKRTQGLMVAPGNPLGLATLADLTGRRIRFVNRDLGTGTRLVFDELLAQSRFNPSDIWGYEDTEASHAAVAQSVAAGLADAGLGIESAARTCGLGFVPLLQESYYLVCLKSVLQEPAVAALLTILQSPHWQAQLAGLAGYTPQHSGQVQSLRKVLPWWNFAQDWVTS